MGIRHRIKRETKENNLHCVEACYCISYEKKIAVTKTTVISEKLKKKNNNGELLRRGDSYTPRKIKAARPRVN